MYAQKAIYKTEELLICDFRSRLCIHTFQNTPSVHEFVQVLEGFGKNKESLDHKKQTSVKFCEVNAVSTTEGIYNFLAALT